MLMATMHAIETELQRARDKHPHKGDKVELQLVYPWNPGQQIFIPDTWRPIPDEYMGT